MNLLKNKKIKAVLMSFCAITLLSIPAVSASINADHSSNINWDKGYRWVTANTQAYQTTGNGTRTNISSYTRARFEYPWYMGGGSYCDSDRQWSATVGGKSYATSGKELYKTLDSGVAKSYWGT